MEKRILDVLFEHGIDTYVQPVITPILTSAEREITIGAQLAQPLGLIFGLSLWADGVTPTNDPLITSAEASSLYLTLKDGHDDFIYPIRLDALLFTVTGFPNVNSKRFLDVNINANFDLSTSYYDNPTGIVSVDTTKKIMLNLWYISTDSYLYLMNEGIVKQDPKAFLKRKK